MANCLHASRIYHATTLVFVYLFMCISIGISNGDDGWESGCLMLYKDGATTPAIRLPPKCPANSRKNSRSGCKRVFKEHWKKLRGDCQVADLKGRRAYQEDRIFCALDINVPWPGRAGMQTRKVGLLAVFDGHNGAEASELAVNLLPEYFILHVYFLLEGIHSGEPVVEMTKNAEGFFEAGQLSRRVQRNELLSEYRRNFEDISTNTGGLKDTECYGLHCLEVCSKEDDGQFSFEVSFKDGFMRKIELHRSWRSSLRYSEDTLYRMILKEALLRAIYDIDVAFSNEAFRSDLHSGSTACIVLKADEYVLVANIGDSKALLCSTCSRMPQQSRGASWRKQKWQQRNNKQFLHQENLNNSFSLLCVKELTQDHHPDRDEEKARIEAAGGFVLKWGDIPRVNGELAISRAIGDISFKKYGVISEPEVTDWQRLSSNDSYLIVASDGVFEKMNTQDICNLLLEAQLQNNNSTEIVPVNAHSLAWTMVNAAFERGSMDNLAAAVLPLDSATCSARSCFQNGFCSKKIGKENVQDSNDAVVSSSHQRKNLNLLADLPGMLIQVRQDAFSCYHLIENLDDDKDYVFLRPNKDKFKNYDGVQASPEGIIPLNWQGQLDLYHDQQLCLSLQLPLEDGEKKCWNPEGFANFFGLIRSIPFDSPQLNSTEGSIYGDSNFKYFLRRRYDRGSFGEVWLAIHKNCSQNGDRHEGHAWEGRYASFNNIDNSFSNHGNSTNFSSSSQGNDNRFGLENDETFILKRIMVERGNHAYLSGLREKHFGEIFLNASVSLGGLQCKFPSKSLTKFKEAFNAFVPGWMNKSFRFDTEASQTFEEQCEESVLQEKVVEDEEGLKHIARYVESFETQSKDFWLVFRNEGQSLSKLIYTAEAGHQHTHNKKSRTRENVRVLQPSSWWRWLKQTEDGNEVLRNLIQQLLWAAKACHDRNIIHRDIKPENMVVCVTDKSSGNCLRGSPVRLWPYNITMRIIDFGSAIDQFTRDHLYGVNGPSRAEQTLEYAPPEALLHSMWFHDSPDKTLKYDMWSIGVVMLELILGTPHVFEISARTRVLIDQHLEGWSEAAKELAYRLRALMEMCILLPGSSPHSRHQQMGDTSNRTGVWPASWECSEEAFAQQIKERDQLKLGFPNIWALRLVRKLLQWHPEDRISAEEGLHHPYFNVKKKPSTVY